MDILPLLHRMRQWVFNLSDLPRRAFMAKRFWQTQDMPLRRARQPEIRIRVPSPQDAAAIFDLERTILEESLMRGFEPGEAMPRLERRIWLENTLANPHSLVMVGEERRNIVAWLEAHIDESHRSHDHILRFSLAVAPGHRSRRFGSGLVQRMILWAQERPQIEKISVRVASIHSRKLSFFGKMGFQEEGRLRRETKLPGGEYVDEVQLALFPERTADEKSFAGPDRRGHGSRARRPGVEERPRP